MRDTVLYERVAIESKPLIEVPIHEVGLGIELPRAVAGGEHVIDETSGEASESRIGSGHDPSDGAAGTIVKKPKVRLHTECIVDPDVAGARFRVSSVEFAVGTVLFDDEDVHPELQDLMELSSGELVEVEILNRHREEPSVQG